MKLIIGLGNYGSKYDETRHNVGFMALDYIKDSLNDYNGLYFEDFALNKALKAKISTGKLNSNKILLIKPQTYMNNSGLSVKKIVSFYKLTPEKDLIAIYDDIDLPIGLIRTKGKSSGGHKGMQSIIDHLKTNDISRIRIGILGQEKKTIKDTASYVLQNFKQLERKKIEDSFDNILPLIKNFIKNK
jgi:PTH1 family peptidyl-tRNA hydrolase